MSQSQIFRDLVSERLAAAAGDVSALYDRMITECEEELHQYEEENHRKQQLLDQMLNPRVVLHRVDHCPNLNHYFPETPPIKEEPEEQRVSQEPLPEPVPESSAVCLKREETSLLQFKQFEQRKETQQMDISSEPHLHSEGLTEHSDDTDNEDWKHPLSFSDTEMETEPDGDHDQVQVRNRSTNPSAQNKSAPETSATVHKGDMTRPDAGERNRHQCSVCTKTFKTKWTLQRHRLVHTGEKPFRCSVCTKTFIRKEHLDRHRRAHTGDKPFTCSVCTKTFSQKHNLDLHRRTHTGDKPFRCSVCIKTFSQKSTLNRHRRTHTGDKPFTCSVCTKTFSQKWNLNLHRRTHTGEKPFRCLVCHKTFTRKQHLESHRPTHTGEKPYWCETCNKTFAHETTLRKHKRTHTGEKP